MISWQLTALISTLAVVVLVAYAVWSLAGLERAKGQRDALRLEMEAGAVKTFTGDIAELKTKLDLTRLRVTQLEANKR